MQKAELKNKLLATKMFYDNKHLDQYCQLIIDNLNTKKIKTKTQRHHIIQRKFFNKNDLSIDNTKSNLVNLLYKDHILAHYYLYLCTKSWLKKANAKTLINMLSLTTFNATDFEVLDLNKIQSSYEQIQHQNFSGKFLKKSDLKYQYITLNKSRKELPNIFDCDLSTIDRWLKRYKIFKQNDHYNTADINKECFIEYYINQDHTQNETAEYFNCSLAKLKGIQKRYNIYKDPMRKIIRPKCQKVQKEDLYRLYQLDNHTIDYCANYFGCSTTTIKKYIKENNFYKRKEITN